VSVVCCDVCIQQRPVSAVLAKGGVWAGGSGQPTIGADYLGTFLADSALASML